VLCKAAAHGFGSRGQDGVGEEVVSQSPREGLLDGLQQVGVVADFVDLFENEILFF